jgi:hypothetical protein
MSRPMPKLTEEPIAVESTNTGRSRHSHQAYLILLSGFVVLPIIAGSDKFFHLLVNWPQYLAPIIPSVTGISAPAFMIIVGVIEIVVGIIVAVKPKFGGMLVAAWLWGIIINLLLIPGYYDIALRDFGLSLGALALARLSHEFSS